MPPLPASSVFEVAGFGAVLDGTMKKLEQVTQPLRRVHAASLLRLWRVTSWITRKPMLSSVQLDFRIAQGTTWCHTLRAIGGAAAKQLGRRRS